MLNANDYKSILPDPLLEQIEELRLLVREIQGDAARIVRQSKVSDARIELQNVLDSTETATHAILDSILCAQDIFDKGENSPDDKIRVRDYAAQIMEACSFQDITGQQIKKVLKGFTLLQSSILKLAHTAKTSCTPPDASDFQEESVSPLLNGPQLSHEAPSQKDIDRLFDS